MTIFQDRPRNEKWALQRSYVECICEGTRESYIEGVEAMKVKLNYTGTVDVYDVNTTYAASMNAPGLQRLCKWAEENGGNLSKESIQ